MSFKSCFLDLERTWQDYLRDSQSALLLDIRTKADYDSCHPPLAIWIEGDLSEQITALLATQDIYVYCETGVRSLPYCHELRCRGLKAFSLKGGLSGLFASKRDETHDE